MSYTYTIQQKIDFRQNLGPVWQQKGLKACTACVLCDALAWTHYGLDLGRKPYPSFSPLFLYYNARQLQKKVSVNASLDMETTIQALQSFGVCLDRDWPFEPRRFAVKPEPEVYQKAKQIQKIKTRNLPHDKAQLIDTLQQGQLFYLGLRLFPSNFYQFTFGETVKTARVKPPAPGENHCSNHAVLVVGYHEKKREFIIRNSFGKNWGDQGHFFLDESYLLDPKKTFGIQTLELIH